jgi:hypothetical protein
MRKTMAQRGYGREHLRIRREVARVVDAGLASCSICRGPIAPGSLWDLDHTDDRSGYRGPAHQHCNRSAGASRGNRMRRRRRFVSESW